MGQASAGRQADPVHGSGREHDAGPAREHVQALAGPQQAPAAAVLQQQDRRLRAHHPGEARHPAGAGQVRHHGQGVPRRP